MRPPPLGFIRDPRLGRSLHSSVAVWSWHFIDQSEFRRGYRTLLSPDNDISELVRNRDVIVLIVLLSSRILRLPTDKNAGPDIDIRVVPNNSNADGQLTDLVGRPDDGVVPE